MSTGRTILRHPVVIAGAALGLILVALLNIHTFAGAGSLLGIGSGRGDPHLTPPADLAAVVQDAVRADRQQRPLAVASYSPGAELVRDPFRGSAGAVTAAAPPQPETPRPNRRVAAADPLVCSAVFLGGHRPQALIDDETFGPGDKVRSLEILSIDADGVLLQRPDGSLVHLGLGPTGLARSRTTGGSQ